MKEKQIYGRIQQKHDIEENWLKAINFIPRQGEIIIYDIDDTHNYERLKIGDGLLNVNQLLFVNDIDYSVLAFDTTELVIGSSNTTSVLGQAILGQLVLA